MQECHDIMVHFACRKNVSRDTYHIPHVMYINNDNHIRCNKNLLHQNSKVMTVVPRFRYCNIQRLHRENVIRKRKDAY